MPPPIPIMRARPAIGPRALPPPIAFIMSAMLRCIFRSLLTSSTLEPAPAAMRFLRLALRMSGCLRSPGVIESMIAIWRLSTLSSRLRSASWFLILATPGIIAISPLMPPIFAMPASCSRRSLRSNWPLRIRSAARIACSRSIEVAAFSTSATMSPMPRMRPAIRPGSKSSSASMRSPVPISLIGLPVTARIDSAAPPRPSPSTRVSTMPVRPTRSSNELRQIDRVLAGEGVGDQQHLVRIGGAPDLGRLVHHLFVERDAAGGVEQHHVVAAELGRLDRAAGDLHGRLPLDDRQGRHVDLLAEHGELLHRGGPARVERRHQHLGVALAQALGDLRSGGGFAGALQPDHHDRHRRRRR